MNISECVRNFRRGRPVRLSGANLDRLVALIRQRPWASSHDIASAYAAAPAKAKPKAEPEAKPEPGYGNMTIKSLYKLAKSLGIKGVTNRTKKAAIIKKLRN